MRIGWRRLIAKSWALSKVFYRLRGLNIDGEPDERVWYFAFGANMHDSASQARRALRPIEWRAGRVHGYRLRFNLDARPTGQATPGNPPPSRQPVAQARLNRITRAGLVRLDSTEGVPGRRYRHLWVDAVDIDGRAVAAVTYIAEGKETDANPSLRYITLLRDGARAHDLPEHYLRFLDEVKPAE